MHQKLLSAITSQPFIGETIEPETNPANQSNFHRQAPLTTSSQTILHLKRDEDENPLVIHYCYEKRFQSMKRGLHLIYNDLLDQSQNGNVKMIVGTRNHRSARHELIRKRPKISLLKDRQRPSM